MTIEVGDNILKELLLFVRNLTLLFPKMKKEREIWRNKNEIIFESLIIFNLP